MFPYPATEIENKKIELELDQMTKLMINNLILIIFTIEKVRPCTVVRSGNS